MVSYVSSERTVNPASMCGPCSAPGGLKVLLKVKQCCLSTTTLPRQTWESGDWFKLYLYLCVVQNVLEGRWAPRCSGWSTDVCLGP